jgi:nucleotide-binding universal stress UspA family protein
MAKAKPVRRQALEQRSPAARGEWLPSGALLVATDFSEASRHAFDAAVALAQDLKAGIVLVHAAAPPWRDALPKSRKRVRAPSDAEGEAGILSEWAEAARGRGVKVSPVYRAGDPAQLILQAARDNDCSMLALAASGKGMLRSLLMGSTARDVIRRTRLPVLVVPHRAHKARKDERPPSRTIVVGLDLSPESQGAYDAAIELAKDLKAMIRLVHVVELPMPAVGYEGAVMPASLIDKMEQEGAAMLVHHAAKARKHKVSVVPVLHLGHAPSVLLGDAKQSGASMIVVGTHGKSAGRQFLLGSVAQALAQMSDRPVLLVPDPTAVADAGGWTR